MVFSKLMGALFGKGGESKQSAVEMESVEYQGYTITRRRCLMPVATELTARSLGVSAVTSLSARISCPAVRVALMR